MTLKRRDFLTLLFSVPVAVLAAAKVPLAESLRLTGTPSQIFTLSANPQRPFFAVYCREIVAQIAENLCLDYELIVETKFVAPPTTGWEGLRSLRGLRSSTPPSRGLLPHYPLDPRIGPVDPVSYKLRSVGSSDGKA